MNIPISRRMRACCELVHPGDRVADVGCDHGYVGIYLLRQGIAASVIASDVREKPLQTAMSNARRFGVAEKMRFFLADGLVGVPREFNTLICAGMGADLMISILRAAPWLQSSRYRLILQCQTRTPCLRRYLSNAGWRIAQERILHDGHFLYTVMEVCWQPEAPRLTPAQWHFPPVLLDNPAPERAEYHRRAVESLGFQLRSNPSLAPILKELMEETP